MRVLPTPKRKSESDIQELLSTVRNNEWGEWSLVQAPRDTLVNLLNVEQDIRTSSPYVRGHLWDPPSQTDVGGRKDTSGSPPGWSGWTGGPPQEGSQGWTGGGRLPGESRRGTLPTEGGRPDYRFRPRTPFEDLQGRGPPDRERVPQGTYVPRTRGVGGRSPSGETRTRFPSAEVGEHDSEGTRKSTASKRERGTGSHRCTGTDCVNCRVHRYHPGEETRGVLRPSLLDSCLLYPLPDRCRGVKVRRSDLYTPRRPSLRSYHLLKIFHHPVL